MEAVPKRKGLKVRTPFSDCTNTITNTNTPAAAAAPAPAITSSQSLSASTLSLKRKNPKLSSVTKTLFADLNPKTSAPPPSSPSTPASAPAVSSSVSCTGDFGTFEPCSVYTRRSTSVRKRSKGKENIDPRSCPPALKIWNIGNKTNADELKKRSEESITPPKKKQRAVSARKNISKHDLPQDFIEKQRAYFAEIDAFELPEEEVDSVD